MLLPDEPTTHDIFQKLSRCRAQISAVCRPLEDTFPKYFFQTASAILRQAPCNARVAAWPASFAAASESNSAMKRFGAVACSVDCSPSINFSEMGEDDFSAANRPH